ncbi:MAG: hypothetical protein AAGA56_31100, partial [Myxococcota bacterium]
EELEAQLIRDRQTLNCERTAAITERRPPPPLTVASGPNALHFDAKGIRALQAHEPPMGLDDQHYAWPNIFALKLTRALVGHLLEVQDAVRGWQQVRIELTTEHREAVEAWLDWYESHRDWLRATRGAI